MGLLQRARILLLSLVVISVFVTLPLHPHKPSGLRISHGPLRSTNSGEGKMDDPNRDVAAEKPSAEGRLPTYVSDIVPFVWKPMTEAESRSLFDKTASPPAAITIQELQQTPTDIGFSPSRYFMNPYLPLNRTRRACTNFSYTRGKWVKDESLRRAERYPSVGEILGCCQRGLEQLRHEALARGETPPDDVRPELLYRWETDDCDLIPWSEELFCKALRGRDIMIAGDSLNDHWHASLYYLLGGRKDIYKREGTIQGKKACKTHPICGAYYPRPLKLYFLTNQLLQEERRLNRNYKWWKHISRYPILVLNAGSWMRDPANEERLVSDEEYFRHMRKALAIVKSLYNGTVIWRTTYQGHPYCWNYKEPLERPLRDEEFPRVVPYLRYRWWAIPHRNNYTTRLWQEAGAHILDVAPMTNLMPLGHLSKFHPKYSVRNVTDCLHYCSPGPIYDNWSMLLMNLLAGNL